MSYHPPGIALSARPGCPTLQAAGASGVRPGPACMVWCCPTWAPWRTPMPQSRQHGIPRCLGARLCAGGGARLGQSHRVPIPGAWPRRNTTPPPDRRLVDVRHADLEQLGRRSRRHAAVDRRQNPPPANPPN